MSTTETEFLSVKRFSQNHPDWTEGALRDLIFNALPRKSSRGELPGNGFAPAIVRVSTSGTGRGKILIDEKRFFEIVAQHRQSD